MGNIASRRRRGRSSQYTKVREQLKLFYMLLVIRHVLLQPTGLYSECLWDEKTVKKLITKKKLAPRHPGQDASHKDSEECPICFLVHEDFF